MGWQGETGNGVPLGSEKTDRTRFIVYGVDVDETTPSDGSLRKNRKNHFCQWGNSAVPVFPSVRHRNYAANLAFATLPGRNDDKGQSSSQEDGLWERPMSRLCFVVESTCHMRLSQADKVE
jgi:hypothetical protein